MVPFLRSLLVVGLTAFVLLPAIAADNDDQPLSSKERTELTKVFDESIEKHTKLIEDDPKDLDAYSRRGDAYLFRGNFEQAMADYEKMVELNPKLEAAHWRRGIAYFYNGQYKKAAHQFEIYHTFDDVDRENGIWRFLSQSKAYGIKKAREGLLKYQKDDREPFPAVYKLFAGKIKAEDILKEIDSAKIDDEAREVRLFYAHLYIGLNAVVENKPTEAKQHLAKAVANKWAPKASYGPNYMWQIGRVHYDLLKKMPSKTD